MAFLLLLESLSPVERAVFLLREVFDYGYDEIAAIVGKSEVNCRKIAARARQHVEEGRPRFEASRRRREELGRTFFAAVEEGDVQGLVRMLAEDVVAYGDGGGQVRGAFPQPILGKDKVGRLMPIFIDRARSEGWTMHVTEVNGQPGCVWVDREGDPTVAISLDIADDQVQTIRAVANPDKLRHLQRVER
jgi:RNA polymerase sigma-70 factor (ECF subfamily)